MLATGWAWVTGIASCTSAALADIRFDILQIIQERPPVALVQMHHGGAIYRHTNLPCTAAACPG